MTEPVVHSYPMWVRRLAIGVAALRTVLPIAALAFLPVLIPDRVPLLVLVRPGKEFLLLGGGLLAVDGRPTILALALAFVPLGLLGAWAFFVVGRAYGHVLDSEERPAWLARLVPPRSLALGRAVLRRRGPAIALLGRLAALPPTVTAAAAGASPVRAAPFLAADAVGSALAFAVTVGTGIALGAAYDDGSVWVTAGGVALFLVLLSLLSRWVRREAAAADAQPPAA